MDHPKYLKDCTDCDDFEVCPFPELLSILDQLARDSFDGDVNIVFRDGLPQKLRKQEIIEFIRI